MAHKKSRKHDFGRGSGGGVNLGLIITPMLDMSFQLLAFFVMTYHPPVNVGFVEGALLPPTREKVPDKPKAKENKNVNPKGGPKDPPPPVEHKEPDLTADLLLVVVRTVQEGQKEGDRTGGDPRAVEIKRPEQLNPQILSGNPNLAKKEFVKDLRKALDDELKKILDEPANKALKEKGKTEVKLEVDGKLKHGYWMSFYDTCKQAGFQNISFVAPAPDPQVQPR
jgi:biopolymer transport protein ExbD